MATTMFLSLVFVAILAHGGVWALLEPLKLPAPMAECIRYRTSISGNVSVPFHTLGAFCLNMLLYSSEKERADPVYVNETMAYASELFRQMITEHQAVRQKRQAFQPRIRQEIRMMSDRSRNRYLRAVRNLKNQRFMGGRNRYDYIADIHRFVTNSAHFGPAFLGWHRIYLILFEYSLGRGIGIPYWDSRLDFYMTDPIESILWSSRFFGNGNSFVTIGPFANWVTSDGDRLQRFVGSGGTLITDEAVNRVLSQTSFDDITEPSANPANSLEIHHNGPHVWVGGLMEGLLTSSHDPVFFAHHCFIDYIWELFRELHPDTIDEYTDKGSEEHDPYAPMSPFRGLRNIDGSHLYYADFFQYARSPVFCPCRSRYLECSPSGRCRSIVGAELGEPERTVSAFGRLDTAAAGAADVVDVGPRFQTPFVDPRTQGVPSAADVAMRFRRSINNPPQENTTLEAKAKVIAHMTYGDSQMTSGYVNSFKLDGVHDMNAWAYIPVRVIFENHIKVFLNGSFEKENVYSNCQTSGAGAAKIFVQTDGLDYSGRYKDYVIVDERQEITSTVSYVGVKNPDISESKFIMTAYDTCGRVCSPRCKNGENYVSCSGTFFLSNKTLTGYSLTKHEAVDSVWKNNGGLLAEPNNDNIPVAFLCETGNSFPWNI